MMIEKIGTVLLRKLFDFVWGGKLIIYSIIS